LRYPILHFSSGLDCATVSDDEKGMVLCVAALQIVEDPAAVEQERGVRAAESHGYGRSLDGCEQSRVCISLDLDYRRERVPGT
jgi:hypothetical protein